ncbi:threonine-phosphate decarboxylase [Rhodococcus spelaei]|uniref:Threonine-phosphate decarboxylase n=1 Tax=Rhodococcus spelaei TaxID=2546320 RepID=A0A541BMH2_9NOCA|nr:Rv2231c family pyridoxal phosphate-dependent protein CobC [Rhodococcus spelaei]TQF73517.1 threonine-phosphate decarboxylase [Rhodococcus spelaei]
MDERTDLRHHGDVDAEPGLLDFAVNVRGDGPPDWLAERLLAGIATLGRYPSVAAEEAARDQVAARHGRRREEVLLLSGAAEGFAMLPRLGSSAAVLLHPSFTEPEWALREAGVPVERVVLDAPYRLDPASVPGSADLVVLGNPTNPTSVQHRAADVLALRRPGRILVVDEAFADAVPGEPESLAGMSLPDVLVLRSLTKTFALAGLRCGYVLGPPELLAQLQVGRPHWPLGSLQVEAIRACCEPAAVEWAQREARTIEIERAEMVEMLTAAGISVSGPACGPFLLLRVPDGDLVRKKLRERGIAVRRGDTFPGLGPDHVRVAVRAAEPVSMLVAALTEVLT